MNKKIFLAEYMVNRTYQDMIGIAKIFLVMESLLILFFISLLYAFGMFGIGPVVGVLFGAILLAIANLYIRKIYQEAKENWEHEQI